jgi:predicted phosphohydrolase
MSVYAIGDLHLAVSIDKPMDVFGGRWQDYMERLEDNWSRTVSVQDFVLIPGDISWATYLEQAYDDFALINRLPGRKIISKGNHDYWWNTLSKLEKYINQNSFNTISFIHNNCYKVEDTAVCGTRGWKCPGDDDFSAEDQKLYNREIQRLELSLKCAVKTNLPITVMLHYPPFSKNLAESGFTQLMKRYNVRKCVYGHLHGEYFKNAYSGILDNIEYHFVAADHLQFMPRNISLH